MKRLLDHIRASTRAKIALIAIAAILIAVVAFMPRREINPAALSRVRPIYQEDYTETVAVFGGQEKSVSSSGCGAVCMSMAIEYLTGRRVSPQSLFDWAYDNGHYHGDGLSHEVLREMAQLHGISGRWIENEQGPVLAALGKGYPVIAHMGPGTFTSGGHYILLRGIDADGRIMLNDPASPERTDTPYDLSLIMSELRRDRSFMVLTP